MSTPISQATDQQLVRWAVNNGWRYYAFNDQLASPHGFLVTANGWANIGSATRQQILEQMQKMGVNSIEDATTQAAASAS